MVMPDEADEFIEHLRQAPGKARQAVERFNLSPEEREWVEKAG